MDTKTAVMSYQFSERAKSELILVSQMLMILAELKGEQQAGGKRILLALMDGVRAEIEFARRSTEQTEFQKAIGYLSGAISLVESGQFGPAGLKVSEAISAVTTPAQNAWQVLTGHGLL